MSESRVPRQLWNDLTEQRMAIMTATTAVDMVSRELELLGPKRVPEGHLQQLLDAIALLRHASDAMGKTLDGMRVERPPVPK